MAITVKSTPLTNAGTYPAAHNDLWFVVDSDNKTEPNFKYVFDLYVDAVKVGTFKVYPEPTYSYGEFNASNAIRSYLNSYYFYGEQDFLEEKTEDGFFQKGFVVKYGEEYGATVTTYTNLVVSPTYTVYNYYHEMLPISTGAGLNLYATNFLTKEKAEQRVVTLKDNYYVAYWNPLAAAKTFTVTTYDASGVLISDTTFVISSAVFIQLNCGPMAINALAAGVLDSSVDHYTVDDGANYMAFKLDCFPKYEPLHLVYLNRLGAYESAHFRMKNRRTVNVERKTYGKKNYGIASVTGMITKYETLQNVRLGNGGTMAIKHTNKFKLSADYLSDADFERMMELMNSPVVYLEQITRTDAGTYYTTDDVEYFPVRVIADSFDLKTRKVHGLSAFEVDVEILETYNSQFL